MLYFNAKLEAFLDNYSAAVPYCQQSCDAIEGVHGSQSIELMQELPNLAELLLRR